ncbi:MAG: twitch domain-containing radical SAM protein, partial [Deltaproteobacteria bacterium]|nr:twitch domain-containing radical SAM protein [Deltaproteobacteria bacterium]
MMPWTHLHFWPDGKAFPCCIADSTMPVGRFGEQSIADIWNSDKLRAIRRNMLEERPSPECIRCYTLEGKTEIVTLRQMSNQKFAHHFGSVGKTRKNGSVTKVNMAYLDIRFSNLCNLRCQTCGPGLSSSWYEDQVNAWGHPGHAKLLSIPDGKAFWKELEPLLENVENGYFAGGEPLLCEEHYRVLDRWLELGKTDIQINYTTNFSRLKLGKHDAIHYWKQFKNVRIAASLDAAGERAEYLRKGTRWKQVAENRRRMLRECPEVPFAITPTISIYNVWHFPDFHREWIEEGLVEVNALHLNILTVAPFMSAHLLPKVFKKEISEKYRRALDILVNRAIRENKPYANAESGYRSVISYIDQKSSRKLVEEFFDRVRSIDKVR